MSNTKTVVLALVAVVLVLGVCYFISSNPWAAAGLAPALLAIAKILTAVSGDTENSDKETGKGIGTSVARDGKVLEGDTSKDEITERDETAGHDEITEHGDEKDQDIEKRS